VTSPALDGEASQRRRPADALLLAAVSLQYGPRVIRFSAAEPGLLLEIVEPHTGFVVPDDRPVDLEVRCRLGEPSPTRGAPSFDASAWEVRRLPDGSEETCFFGTVDETGRGPFAVLTVDAAFRCAGLVQRPFVGERILRLGYPVDEYVATRLLGRRGDVVLHAAAVVDEGRALLFCGHSGAGKSTISQLAERGGARVLSDDRTIVRAGEDGVTAFGTPWHGSYRRGANEAAPVGAIFLLVQSPDDRLVPLTPAEAVKELFVRLIRPTGAPEEIGAALDALGRVAAGVPVAELRFRPTTAAFELARSAARR
jgi:hypothetical protein